MFICIDLTWPKRRPDGRYYDIYFRDFQLTKNKFLEVQLTRPSYGYTLFRFEFGWHPWQDHGGAELELGALGVTLILNFHDYRHWNHEEGRFQTDAEAAAEALEWEAKTNAAKGGTNHGLD